MKRRIRKLCVSFMAFVATFISLFSINGSVVSAAEGQVQSAPLIMLEKYSITDEKIVPGQDFTLTLVLKNCGSVQSVSNVMIDIGNPDGVAPVYGTVSQVFVGNIRAGESKEITIDYNSWISIAGDTLDFNLTIVSDQATNYIILRAPVGADSPFSIISAPVSSEIEEGAKGSASLAFKVLGENNVRNVVMLLKENGEVIASSTIGIVTPGASKTQSMTFELETVGEHTVDLLLQYVDEADQTKEVLVGSVPVTVNPKEGISENPTEPAGDNDGESTDGTNIAIMGISGILILVICLLVVIVLRKNK